MGVNATGRSGNFPGPYGTCLLSPMSDMHIEQLQVKDEPIAMTDVEGVETLSVQENVGMQAIVRECPVSSRS